MKLDIYSEINSFFDEHYKNNSLAYYGLTTKVEIPFRDAFSYYLFEKYSNQKLIARELMRTDLVILNSNSEIESSIEFKAWYSFDLTSKNKNVVIGAENDFDKYDNEKVNNYYIILSIRPLNLPDKKYKKIIKYYPGIKSESIKNNNDNSFKKSLDSIEELFSKSEKLKLSNNGSSLVGDVFGSKVYLDYFIFIKK